MECLKRSHQVECLKTRGASLEGMKSIIIDIFLSIFNIHYHLAENFKQKVEIELQVSKRTPLSDN